jgi:hypothetical protein
MCPLSIAGVLVASSLAATMISFALQKYFGRLQVVILTDKEVSFASTAGNHR